MRTHWTTIWRAVWGPITNERATAIAEYLREKMGGLSEPELQTAIESLADSGDGSEKMHTAPSIKTIEWTIKSERKRHKGINLDEPFEYTQAKRDIRNAPVEGDTRWNIICGLPDRLLTPWAYMLEDYAMANGGLCIPRFVWGNHRKDAARI